MIDTSQLDALKASQARIVACKVRLLLVLLKGASWDQWSRDRLAEFKEEWPDEYREVIALTKPKPCNYYRYKV